MIGHQYPGGSVDEVAVRRDDELLERLGARSATGELDVAASLLRALTVDVDREPDATSAQAGPAEVTGQASWRRRHGARGTVIGAVVVATLSVSGVAAAVTGDPLSPYRAVLSLGQDDDPAPRRGALPGRAANGRDGTPAPGAGVRVAAPGQVTPSPTDGLQVFRKSPTGAADTTRSPGRSQGRPGPGTDKPPRDSAGSGGRDGPATSPKAAEAAETAKAAEAAKAAETREKATAPKEGEATDEPTESRPASEAGREAGRAGRPDADPGTADGSQRTRAPRSKTAAQRDTS